MVVSYQWLHDKVKERRKERMRQSQEDWFTQMKFERAYENGATIRIKTQDGESERSSAPPQEIRGRVGAIQFLHGWVATQGRNRGIYAVFVGDETHLIDENWLELPE